MVKKVQRVGGDKRKCYFLCNRMILVVLCAIDQGVRQVGEVFVLYLPRWYARSNCSRQGGDVCELRNVPLAYLGGFIRKAWHRKVCAGGASLRDPDALPLPATGLDRTDGERSQGRTTL